MRLGRGRLDAPDPMNDPGRVLQTAEERVRGGGPVLEPQVGVVHRTLAAPLPFRAIKIAQAEILPHRAAFVA